MGQSLREVFVRLRDAGLKVKFAKCVWAAAECRVLGSVFNQQGIKPDPDKVEAVNQLPVPRNVADMRSFLGAAGYFHEHIPNFAATTAPLRTLLTKGVKFEWADACQHAFTTLKQQLVFSDCLRMPHLDKPFILNTDWLKDAAGAVLSQHQLVNAEVKESPFREYVTA